MYEWARGKKWKRGWREQNLLRLFAATSILSISYWWTQHINWLIISLPPYVRRSGRVRLVVARFATPLIRTIMPSPSWGPVTQNGVRPLLRLVSPSPGYESSGRKPQCRSAGIAELTEQLPQVRGGRVRGGREWREQEKYKGQVKRETTTERDGRGNGGWRGLKPRPQWEVTVSIKLTLVTSGWIWSDVVQWYLTGEGCHPIEVKLKEYFSISEKT